MYMLKKNSC